MNLKELLEENGMVLSRNIIVDIEDVLAKCDVSKEAPKRQELFELLSEFLEENKEEILDFQLDLLTEFLKERGR